MNPTSLEHLLSSGWSSECWRARPGLLCSSTSSAPSDFSRSLPFCSSGFSRSLPLCPVPSGLNVVARCNHDRRLLGV
eukprot:2947593-Rhodomonas_salina.3